MDKKKFTLKELSLLIDAKFIGDESLVITGVNALEEADLDQASFLSNSRYCEAMKNSKAGVICIAPDISIIQGKNFFISKNPSKTFQKIAELFINPVSTGFSGIHKTSTLHEKATIGENVTIGPNVVVDAHTTIAKNTKIFANTYIGANVVIGEDTTIYSNVSIREGSKIGNKVIIQPGAVIGSCGFGYIPDETGKYHKLKQLGNVVIEDDVEIGANTTIDRARFGTTLIKKGAKIDNLVQIAHNVKISENAALAAQSGISGSTEIGKNVVIAGQVGIVGHVKISDYVQISAQSGVSKSLSKGKYRGTPAIEYDKWNREYIRMRKISKHIDTIKQLEEKIDKLLN